MSEANTEDNRAKCSKRECGWIGLMTELRQVRTGVNITESRCPRCDNNSFYTPKPSEVEKRKTGAQLISLERGRQLKIEGWTPEHDDSHNKGEMCAAAIAYAAEGAKIQTQVKVYTEPQCHCGARGMADCTCVLLKPTEKWVSPWPWEKKWWKPSEDKIKNLVRAGALIAAEIDRLQRLAAKNPNSDNSVNPV